MKMKIHNRGGGGFRIIWWKDLHDLYQWVWRNKHKTENRLVLNNKKGILSNNITVTILGLGKFAEFVQNSQGVTFQYFFTNKNNSYHVTRALSKTVNRI